MVMDVAEEIEILKGDGRRFFLTGQISKQDADWVTISTIRGETFHFRLKQVMMRRVLSQEELVEKYQRIQNNYNDERSEGDS